MLTCGLAADATVLVCAASVQEHLIHRVTLAADYLGLPKIAAAGLAAAVIVGGPSPAASAGSSGSPWRSARAACC
jgi:hypothetical protein